MLPLLLLLLAPVVSAEPLTQNERNRLMSHLHATRKQFLDALAQVSEAQWKWKPSAETWSVAEVAEHIALSEETLGAMVRKMVKGPAAPAEKLAAVKGKEERMLTGIVDRSQKVQAPEMLKPVQRWKTKAELIAAFKKSRDENIAYIEQTGDELRTRLMPHPALGDLDLYQWLLFVSGHSERHTLQLLEVKTKPGYPGK
jgi:hypothetical protein